MDAFELYNQKGEPSGCWCCGKCRMLVLNPLYEPFKQQQNQKKSTREAAEACCRPVHCGTCNVEVTDVFQIRDRECNRCRDIRWDKQSAERHAERIAAAADVSAEYDGPVFVEERSDGSWGEGYFSSLDELREVIEDDEEDSPKPEWAFACYSIRKELDLEMAIEYICDDGYEGMCDHLDIPDSLAAAFQEFNRINAAALTVWNVDFSRKVRVCI